KLFDQRYLIKEKPLKMLVDINAFVMIGNKLQKIHHIIGIYLVRIGLVGVKNVQQRIRDLAKQVPRFGGDICIPEHRKEEAFINTCMQFLPAVLAAKDVF